MADGRITVNGRDVAYQGRRERLDNREVYGTACEWSLAVEACGMDAVEVTELVGVSPTTMAEWLNGRRLPTTEAWNRLRVAYEAVERATYAWSDPVPACATTRLVTHVQPDDDEAVRARSPGLPCVGAWRMAVGRAVFRSRDRLQVLTEDEHASGEPPRRLRGGRMPGSEPYLVEMTVRDGAPGARENDDDEGYVEAPPERPAWPECRRSFRWLPDTWADRLHAAVRACGDDAVAAADAMGRVRDERNAEPVHERVARLPDLDAREAEDADFERAWREAFGQVLAATDRGGVGTAGER